MVIGRKKPHIMVAMVNVVVFGVGGGLSFQLYFLRGGGRMLN